MYRPECSYWLAVEPIDPAETRLDEDTVKSICSQVDILFEGNLVQSDISTESCLQFEVGPDDGTCYQRDDAFDALQSLAKQFPAMTISLKEINEEDHSEGRYMVCQGEETITDRNTRTIECDELWDLVTVKAIVDFIATTDPAMAARVMAVYGGIEYQGHSDISPATFRAVVYNRDDGTVEDEADYDELDEAIAFAKEHD